MNNYLYNLYLECFVVGNSFFTSDLKIVYSPSLGILFTLSVILYYNISVTECRASQFLGNYCESN
jgi:hypothetical protein